MVGLAVSWLSGRRGHLLLLAESDREDRSPKDRRGTKDLGTGNVSRTTLLEFVWYCPVAVPGALHGVAQTRSSPGCSRWSLALHVLHESLTRFSLFLPSLPFPSLLPL